MLYFMNLNFVANYTNNTSNKLQPILIIFNYICRLMQLKMHDSTHKFYKSFKRRTNINMTLIFL